MPVLEFLRFCNCQTQAQIPHEEMEKGFALLPIQKYQIVFHLLPLFQ